MNAPSFTLHLHEEIEVLKKTELYLSSKRSAKTLIRQSDTRVVLIAFQEGGGLSEHKTENGVQIQCLKGEVKIGYEGEESSLKEGMLLFLPQGVPHEVAAQKESAILVTVSWCPSK